MLIEKPLVLLLLIVLTILSGFGDAQGFFHASNIWQNGKISWMEVGKSAAGFSFGIVVYWIVLRYMAQVGVVSPEVQTIIWFVVTLIGVAFVSGQFFKWQLVDQIVAFSLLIGIGWLLIRTSQPG
ncbi:MAG: hypothetical protein CL610_06810 [Anaerolineaceae bacterium]|nr:hypothetical protein [Anaerolineaceae bacterium]